MGSPTVCFSVGTVIDSANISSQQESNAIAIKKQIKVENLTRIIGMVSVYHKWAQDAEFDLSDAFIWVNGTITILADFINLFSCTISYQ
jgi:hypothetical protein